jgi:Phage protein (N4 Gp49/phage Sf6 gene 66) family
MMPNLQEVIMGLITNERLDELLAASPAERVTQEYMESRIANTEFHRLDETVTICSITLDNGYSVRGESACVNPENYIRHIGEKIAYDNAFREFWPLFGFLLAEKNKLRAAA